MNRMNKFSKLLILVLFLTVVGSVTFAPTKNVKAVMFNEFEINSSGELTKYNGIGPVVQIPNTVTAIGQNAFMGNTNISEVDLPKTVKVIKNGAFSTCTNLATVKFNSGLEVIESYAFGFNFINFQFKASIL